jgi:hypothetical protein
MSGSPAGVLQRLLETEKRIPDPGNAGTIAVDRDLGVVALSSTGAESRTMPDPADIGIRVALCSEVVGGTITVTFSSAYDEAGTTTMAFTATGQVANLVSCAQGLRTYVWRLEGNPDGIALPALNVTTLTGTSIKSTSATGGVGYGTGAGGAVTQATSSSTGVTVNTPTGQITTVALTTAAGAEERFTVTNSSVAATDVVVLATTYNGAGTVSLSVQKVSAGAFDVVITNLHASNALNALMVINFAVIKGVAA